MSAATLGERMLTVESVRGRRPPRKPRLVFNFTDDLPRAGFAGNALSIIGGCNSIGGYYRVEDGRLTTSMLTRTERACRAALMKQDDWVVQLLLERPRVLDRGSALLLVTPDTTVVLSPSD